MIDTDLIRSLKDEGHTYAEIAEIMGCSRSTVGRVFSERSRESTLRLSREAKRRRTGTCSVCGTVTHYNGAPGQAISALCPKHANKAHLLRGTGPTNSRALAFLAEPHTFTELRDHLGITSNYTGMLLRRLRRYGLVERPSRGVYVAAEAKP